MQQTKILFLITKSNWGGAQKYVYELAIAAKGAGYEVVVACGGTGEAGAALGELSVRLQAANITIRPIRHFLRNMSIVSDLAAFFEVWRLLRKEQPDVLHVTSSKAGGVGALAGRLAGTKRIIFTSHGLTVDEIWRPRWQRALIYLGTWLTLRLAHHNIMITTETYQRASGMPGLSDRVSLVKNGIGPVEMLDRKAARASLAPHLPPSTLWIGGVGELHPNKNWSAAILALRNLPTHTHLFIIGEGEERRALERQIAHHRLSERVHLAGFRDAAPLLPAFDIFLLPSLKEGLPYVLLEAGLAALPCVASDLPGIRDIIETGETGLLVEPNSSLLNASLEMLVRDDGMRRRLGQAHREKVLHDFSLERMCQETFALYDSSVSEA